MANPEHLAKLKKGVEEWNTWRRSNFTVAPDLIRANLSEADLRGADLRGADLSNAVLSGADLSDAVLTGANLREANLSEAALRHADLTGTALRGAALRDADLSDAVLGGADLSRADLSRADLTGADLREANLSWANLSWANLVRAKLAGANLREADLREANLVGANLVVANLRAADLREANLSGAELGETVFGDTNLKDVPGLETCQHSGPSIVDYRTLAKSGPLPLPFLRGCGLPDEYIEYLPSLLNQTIQFYSCFISYSTKDQAFAERLNADLQNKGVRCWFAPHNIQGGKKVHEQIDEAIRVYDRLLLILSKASMKSEWVKTEIANARQKEIAKGQRVLFPISLVPYETIREWKNFDADTGKDSAREIREYFIPDFSDWKNHDNYQHAFERLLKDLKAEEQ